MQQISAVRRSTRRRIATNADAIERSACQSRCVARNDTRCWYRYVTTFGVSLSGKNKRFFPQSFSLHFDNDFDYGYAFIQKVYQAVRTEIFEGRPREIHQITIGAD